MKKTILASTLAATVLISTPILTTVAQADVATDAISSVTTSTKNTDTTPTQDTANTESATTNESGTDTAVTESFISEGFNNIISGIKDIAGVESTDADTVAASIDNSLVNKYNLTTMPTLTNLFSKSDPVEGKENEYSIKGSDFYDTKVGALQTKPTSITSNSFLSTILQKQLLDKVNIHYKVISLEDGTPINESDTSGYKKGYKLEISYFDSSKDSSTAKPLDTRDEALVYSPSSQIDTDDYDSLNARFTSPYSVAAGTTNASLQGIATDLYIADDNGNTVSNVTNTTGKLYTTEKAAYNATSSKEVTASTLDTVGTTYYQTINVTSTSPALIKLMSNISDDANDDYTLMVNGSEADADNLNINVKSSKKSVTFRLVRAVTVAAPSTAWNITSISGTVTTGSNAIYTLVNDNGDAVANRALSGNSSWRTDTVRTNAAGQKQYRVATNEWIDASSVTFSDGSSTSGSAITSITDLSGSHVVDLATPGFVYALYKTDGGTSTRYVAGGTSWVTDKTGKDAAGNTYYRVSTNEWVMAGTGVSFK